jgi:hypothetical protein
MKPKIKRFAQTEPGELFFFSYEDQTQVGLTVFNPCDDERNAVIFGLSNSTGNSKTQLVRTLEKTVISFEKRYNIRLPVDPRGWVFSAPESDVRCLLVASPDNVFIRANYNRTDGFMPCYINMQTFNIEVDQNRRQFVNPQGYHTFATAWDIISEELESRSFFGR